MCHAALATHVKIRMCAFVCGWRTSRGKPGDVQPHVGLRLNVSNINLLKSFFIKKKKNYCCLPFMFRRLLGGKSPKY